MNLIKTVGTPLQQMFAALAIFALLAMPMGQVFAEDSATGPTEPAAVVVSTEQDVIGEVVGSSDPAPLAVTEYDQAKKGDDKKDNNEYCDSEMSTVSHEDDCDDEDDDCDLAGRDFGDDEDNCDDGESDEDCDRVGKLNWNSDNDCDNEDTVTIVAEKIVCTDEADLPNWGAGAPDISAATAQSWVLNHKSCKFASDWDFQWILDSKKSIPSDTIVGPLAGNWHTFGSTNASGKTSVELLKSDLGNESKIWLREVLKDNYIPFTYGPNNNNSNPVSAEFYCDTDGLNYDNYEWVNNLEKGETYHCVAWNVPKVVLGCTDRTANNYNEKATVGNPDAEKCTYTPICQTKENLLSNGSFELNGVTDPSLWQKFSTVTGWAVAMVTGATPTTLELHKGWSGNVAAQGAQYAELDGDQSVRVSQSVVTIPGATYELRWAFASRQNTDVNQNKLSVEVEGSEVATAGPVAGGAGALLVSDWTAGSKQFVALDSNTEVAFKDAGVSNSYGTFLDDACLIKVKDPVVEPKGTLEIQKYMCPANTVLTRSQNGVGKTVPAGCVVDSGEPFAYVHGSQTDANGPYPELDGALVPAGTTDVNGLLKVQNLPATGRYLVVETNDVNQKLAPTDILGLYCEGDGDTNDANNDNQELTFVPNNGTTKCVAYNKINNDEPKVCEVTLVSGAENTTVVEKNNAFAVLLAPIHTAWTAAIAGASWIWGDNPVAAPVDGVTQTFVRKFGWGGDTVTDVKLYVAADNSYSSLLNGVATATDSGEFNYNLAGQDVYSLATNMIDSGNNVLSINVVNKPSSTDPAANPAGLMYKLVITGTGENCNVPYKEDPKPDTATVTMCKKDDAGKALSGWTLWLDKVVYAPSVSLLTASPYEFSGMTVAETGCVTFANVPYGTYDVGENMQDGWMHVSGADVNLVVDSATELVTIVNKKEGELSCESFVSNEYSVRSGEEFTLSWDMTGALGVYLEGVEEKFGLVDSYETSVSSDRTYTLVVDRKGEQSDLRCPLDIDRYSSGGGGHSSSKKKGSVLGDSEDRPEGGVAGAAAVMPAGAPNTGAGGTSPVVVTLPSLVAVLNARTSVQKTR